MSDVWEVERDRFGVMFSGPLEVGECIRVVSVAERDAALTEAARWKERAIMAEAERDITRAQRDHADEVAESCRVELIAAQAAAREMAKLATTLREAGSKIYPGSTGYSADRIEALKTLGVDEYGWSTWLDALDAYHAALAAHPECFLEVPALDEPARRPDEQTDGRADEPEERFDQ